MTLSLSQLKESLQIQVLSELTRAAIELFIFDYQRCRKRDDKVTTFKGLKVYNHMVKKTASMTLDATNDAHVIILLGDMRR